MNGIQTFAFQGGVWGVSVCAVFFIIGMLLSFREMISTLFSIPEPLALTFCSSFGHLIQNWPIGVVHALTSDWFKHGLMIHFEPIGIRPGISFALLSDKSFLSSGHELGNN